MHSPALVLGAWGVHAYTASGLVAGVFSIIAIFEGHAQIAFFWMLIAVLIDATDGSLARAINVKRVLPRFDGSKLDDIVDYMTFVVCPVLFLHEFGMLPANFHALFVGIPLLASAYGFCQANAKTTDFYFTGFPSYWNILAFYLHVCNAPPWLNGAVIIILAVCVFIPVRYVYPTRTPYLRTLTIFLSVVWTAVLAILLFQFPNPNDWLILGSLFYPCYYTLLSFYLHFKTKRTSQRP